MENCSYLYTNQNPYAEPCDQAKDNHERFCPKPGAWKAEFFRTAAVTCLTAAIYPNHELYKSLSRRDDEKLIDHWPWPREVQAELFAAAGFISPWTCNERPDVHPQIRSAPTYNTPQKELYQVYGTDGASLPNTYVSLLKVRLVANERHMRFISQLEICNQSGKEIWHNS